MSERVTVSAVVKRYGDNYALRNVTCTLEPGEITAIVGSNGAGKTTLIDVVTGFVTPDSGEVRLGSRVLTGLAAYSVARAGIVRSFQEVRLMRTRTCLDNVRLAQRDQLGEQLWRLFLRRGVRAVENEVTARGFLRLQQVGLHDFAEREAARLSYGQQKLLATACCLATNAEVLILDEPFAGLAPAMRLVMADIIITAGRAGSVVAFIDHDMDAVSRCADRLFVMRRGELVADGRTKELLDSEAARRALIG